MAMLIVVTPPNVLVPSSTNKVEIAVNLNNFLIVPSSKLWPEYTNNPMTKIGYAFESNLGVTSLTFCTVVIPRGTPQPLDMDDIHGTSVTRQTLFIVVPDQVS